MLSKIISFFKKAPIPALNEWYEVSWDNEFVYRNVSPPDRGPWSDKFRWDEIIRVCFQAGDFMSSDEVYFFTNKRKESYLIPTEAKNGSELWGEVLERKLFDAELAIEAMMSTSGLICWPNEDT